MGLPTVFSPDQQYIAVDEQTLKNIIKLNFSPDADVVVKDGKVYILLPLDLLFDYKAEGNVIYIKPKVFK